MGPLPGRWALFYACYQVFPTGLPPRQSRQGRNPSLWTAPACRHAPCFSLIWLADLPILQLQHLIPTHWQSLSTKQNMLQSLQNRHSARQAGGIQDCTIWHQAAFYCTARAGSVVLCRFTRQRSAVLPHQPAALKSSYKLQNSYPAMQVNQIEH